jgi:hypothetical protein
MWETKNQCLFILWDEMLVTRLYNHEKLIQNINFEILKQTHFIITKKNMKNENPIIAIVHKPNLNT